MLRSNTSHCDGSTPARYKPWRPRGVGGPGTHRVDRGRRDSEHFERQRRRRWAGCAFAPPPPAHPVNHTPSVGRRQGGPVKGRRY
eukprot:gene6174-biopygen17832